MPGEQRDRIASADPRPRSGPLIERETQLAALSAVLDGACGGVGAAVALEALAGLGKSELLAESTRLAQDRGMLVLRARATQSERDFTFAVTLRLFEPYLALVPSDEREALLGGAAALAGRLLSGELVSADRAVPRSQFALVHGLYWLTANISERAPLLICVDDLQWCDDASLRFLLYLAERLDGSAIALLTAARPRRRTGESEALAALRSAPVSTKMRLSPLGPAGTTEFVRRSALEVSDDFCAACAEVTSGNPFYLHELLLALAAGEGGFSSTDPARIRELGTRSIARAALFRLAGLGSTAIGFAEALVILGDQTPLHRVAELVGVTLGQAADLADELAAEELVSSGPTLAFAHPLISEAIYEEMPPAKRALIHARAARLLRNSSVPTELLAAQLMNAPGMAEDWVVDALREAARIATAHGVPTTAARYLQRALAEGCGTESRDAVLLELGAAETAAGLPGASERIAAVLKRQSDPSRRVEVQHQLARALAIEGNPEAAADVFEQAIEGTAADATHVRVTLLADYLANAAFHPGLRQRSFTRAEPALREPPDGTTAEGRVLLAALAMRAGQDGRPNPDTIALAVRAWCDGALLESDGPDGSGWLMAVWALELAEDHEAAVQVAAVALKAARAIGSVGAFAAASYFHGFACLRLGRLNDAQADAEQAISAAGAEWHSYLVPALVLQTNVLIERAALDDAADTLVRASDLAGDGMFGVPWTLHARGLLAMAHHHPSVALELFEQAGAYLTEQLSAEYTVLPWRADAALAALQVGDRDRARVLIDVELAAVRRTRSFIGQGRALRILGLLIGGEPGLALLARASAQLEPTPAKLEHAHALTDLGAALRRCGRQTEARLPLAAALMITNGLGADLLGARVRDELAASGVRLRAKTDDGLNSLTPSERRVAALAGEHLTNKGIAQALFVTPKTVEYHLRHVYQKLGISNRSQLIESIGERAAPPEPPILSQRG